jgi:hypothetical protein
VTPSAWCPAGVRTADGGLVAAVPPSRNRSSSAPSASSAPPAATARSGSRAAAVLARVEEHLRAVEDPALIARLHLAGVHAGMAVRTPATMTGTGRRRCRPPSS